MSDTLVETFTNEKYRLEIHTDEDSRSPREEYDNLGTLIGWHKRYDIGDDNPFETLDEFKREVKPDQNFILPVFMYEHGGIALSTSNAGYPFNDKWDAGLVGFIYVPKEKVRAEWKVKRITKRIQEIVFKNLISEVKTYSEYMNGDVYGYILYDNETDAEIDSCWGYYGYDWKENGIGETAKEYDIEL